MAHTIEFNEDVAILSAFMSGPDRVTYGRMIGFFSVPEKYLHPRELMRFRRSMTDEEWVDFKAEFWNHMVDSHRSKYTSPKTFQESKNLIAEMF